MTYVDRPSGTLREFSEHEPDSLQVLPKVNGNLFAAWNSKNRSVPDSPALLSTFPLSKRTSGTMSQDAQDIAMLKTAVATLQQLAFNQTRYIDLLQAEVCLSCALAFNACKICVPSANAFQSAGVFGLNQFLTA